ncbi:hypothetical protein OC834_005023 [Tilletia horrida]|nr:hypothetical protein OC834_005023 [Tilletia horrida]
MPVAGKRSRAAAARLDRTDDSASASKETKGKAKKKTKGPSSSSAPDFLTLPPLALDPPQRRPMTHHTTQYHAPLLLSSRTAQDALLSWFDAVRHTRQMDWRKDWVAPSTLSAAERSRRGYEVLVSETMLQQTRIETVKGYYAKWMGLFPDVGALARAREEEVLGAWAGLGYYSRATRLQAAARTIEERYGGVLPSDPVELEKEIPGVGPYTAGAISSIVYGLPSPLLDGNVARVLSRQMGLHADGKSKTVTDVLWRAAELLVVAVSRAQQEQQQDQTTRDTEKKEEQEEVEVRPSSTPGRWNQALMELGSTVCTPFPRCESCPIRSSCRAYSEGRALAVAKTGTGGKKASAGFDKGGEVGVGVEVEVEDIEELCSLCEPMPSLEEALSELSDEEEGGDSGGRTISGSKSAKKKKKVNAKASTAESKLKQSTLSFGPPPSSAASANGTSTKKAQGASGSTSASASIIELSSEAEKIILAHVRQFPLKVAKKKVREEDAVVCIIEARSRSSGSANNGDGEISSAKTAKGGKRKAGLLRETRIMPGSLFLIKQRPDKGLLANMWEMPTHIFEDINADRTDDDRIKAAKTFTSSVLKNVGLPDGSKPNKSALALQAELLGLHTHVFSHLKMHMHAMHVVLEVPDLKLEARQGGGKAGKWVTAAELVDQFSMGNGMRTCWAMVSGAEDA